MIEDAAQLDAVLARVTYEPVGSYLKSPVPFPANLAPTLVQHDSWTGDPLTKVDVLVVTWTSAEWSALADVLSPGREKAQWQPYARNWSRSIKPEFLVLVGICTHLGCVPGFKPTSITHVPK